jgi:hypothetical protein
MESIPNNQRIDGILKSDIKSLIEYSNEIKSSRILDFKTKREMEELSAYLIT